MEKDRIVYSEQQVEYLQKALNEVFDMSIKKWTGERYVRVHYSELSLENFDDFLKKLIFSKRIIRWRTRL